MGSILDDLMSLGKDDKEKEEKQEMKDIDNKEKKDDKNKNDDKCEKMEYPYGEEFKKAFKLED